MRNDPIPQGPPDAGLPAVLRLIAGLAIVTIALLAGLVVLGALDPERLVRYGTRVLLLALIAAATSAAVAALIRSGRRGG